MSYDFSSASCDLKDPMHNLLNKKKIISHQKIQDTLISHGIHCKAVRYTVYPINFKYYLDVFRLNVIGYLELAAVMYKELWE